MRIALAGNPNSGKTTMFNALTGKNERVGNWAGVTVDKKEHSIKKSLYKSEQELIAVDLPGAYSMSPFTAEESVTRDYIKNEHPDAIINIVDSTNLSRSLFFTTQLLELGVPVVVALNKTDINSKKNNKIDTELLSKKLGCPVIETSANKGSGLKLVVAAVLDAAYKEQKAPYYQGDIDLDNKVAVVMADRKRFEFVNSIVSDVEVRKTLTKNRNGQDKIDALLTNKWLGIPIFAVVMFLVFQISQAWLGAWIAEGYEFANGTVIPGLVTLIDMLGEWVGGLMADADPLLYTIVIDGIIGGVGAVVGFLPLVMVMYFLIALLEDCGYMARATVVLDPIFKKVGLSGKSVIPFVVGTGCAVPGVMACRTIRNERERRATAMLAPFMPCGAKLPVIALFASAFFGDAAWVGTTMYFAGIVIILLCALLINKITGNRKKSFFIIELPEYKVPSFPKALISMCQRGWSYIVKAGTVILVCNFIIQLMQSFTWTLTPAEDASQSILASVATPFAYFFAPIVGVVAWQLAAATITGFIAKENVVGTLAVCFAISNMFDLDELSMVQGSESAVASAFGITTVAALAYLCLNLFSPPCFAAIGAMNSELGSKKWLFAAVGLQVGVGYSVGFLVFFFGSLFTGAGFGDALWMPFVGWCVVGIFAAVLACLIVRRNKQLKAEDEQKKAQKANKETVNA